jgi:hypothetical protein
MEEDKAAALYESLSRQGLGAARFKQGLGFGGGATGAEFTSGPISFKKAGADLGSEIENAEQSRKEEDNETPARRNKHESARVVQRIADKLRGKRSFSNHRDRRREENTDSEEDRRSPIRRRSSESEDGHARRRGGRPDSSSPKRRGRSGSEDSTKEGLAGRSRKSERERSPSHGESSEEDRARERRIADRRKEGKGEEGDRRSDSRREEGSRKDGRSDPGRRGADRSTRERGVDTRRRSRSRSRDRGRGGVKGTDPERRHRSREREPRSERYGLFPFSKHVLRKGRGCCSVKFMLSLLRHLNLAASRNEHLSHVNLWESQYQYLIARDKDLENVVDQVWLTESTAA